MASLLFQKVPIFSCINGSAQSSQLSRFTQLGRTFCAFKTFPSQSLLQNANSFQQRILQHQKAHQVFSYKPKPAQKNNSALRFVRRILLSARRPTNAEKAVKQPGSSKSLAAAPNRKDVRRLVSLVRPEKWSLAGAMCCLVVSSGVTMTVPFCIGKIIDLIHNSDKDLMISQLNQVCSALLIVFLVGGLANFGRVYILQTASQRIVRQLRGTLFNSIMRQEVGFFDKSKTGELINRLSSDTMVVANSLSQNISDGLRSLFQVTAGIGMMTIVSGKLAMISMAIVPPVAIGSIIYGRYLRKITKQVQDSLANATQVAEERIATIRTVRAFAHEKKECDAYSDGIQRVLNLSYKESLARGMFWGFTGFSGNVIVISVFYFGGLMMLESNITVGDLSSFLLYATYVGVALGGLTSFYTELNRGIAASHRIWELIDRQPLIELDHSIVAHTTKRLASLGGNLSLRNVSFNYPSRPDMPIFSNLSLDVPAGSVTAVVGPSGSGKSTLSALLLRFYDPQQGQVLLDGVDITQLDPRWLRSNIGTVSQEPVLFSTTIAENISYGADRPHKVHIDQVIDAAQKANAFPFVSTFSDGFDTLVGERGLMLSGGQRQRIAIARAILKDPKILILDEATSALDAESEYLVQEALERLMVGRTVLTIAHRLSTIKSADKIIVIDGGKVVENGTYQELMTLDEGLFRKLVDRQTIVK